MSHNGALRTARDQLIPQMEQLGPRLIRTEGVVRQSLVAHLAAQEVDPGSIPEMDMNKTERHIIIGSFTRQQRRYLVENQSGSADVGDARFRQRADVPVTVHTKRGGVWFEGDVLKTFEHGAEVMERVYTDGTQGQWWPAARLRYMRLGLRAVELTKLTPPAVIPSATPIPKEGLDMRVGLRNKALAKELPRFLRYVNRQVPDPGEHRKAAHDLFYLVTMLAGLHLWELSASVGIGALMGVPVKVGGDGKYRADFSKMHDAMAEVYPHFDPSQLANAKLKCVAHANVEGGNTDLEYLGHAAVNAAFDSYVLWALYPTKGHA